MQGERLSSLISFEACKLGAMAMLFSPFLPLLFMGEEYGETAPFLFFADHQDDHLCQAVKAGREREGKVFGWENTPPDPTDPETFRKSKLKGSHGKQSPKSNALRNFYKQCIQVRKEHPLIQTGNREDALYFSDAEHEIFGFFKSKDNQSILLLLHTGDKETNWHLPENSIPNNLHKRLDSASNDFLGKSKMPEKLLDGKPLHFLPWQGILYTWWQNENHPSASLL